MDVLKGLAQSAKSLRHFMSDCTCGWATVSGRLALDAAKIPDYWVPANRWFAVVCRVKSRLKAIFVG
jgi:hypothetical protein